MKSFVYADTLVRSLLLAGVAAAQQINGINIRDMMEELEHILVDNGGTNADGFVGAITPCLNYLGFAPNVTIRGEQSSAQWVRTAYHDFVLADVSAGTGGLDASIAYEAERAENKGLFINDTLQFFLPTVTAYLSLSDNIALGLVTSVATCGGTKTSIPIRVGRIDATKAAAPGVPGPTTDLKGTFGQFVKAGFSSSETISLVACGHSLGRVHRVNFPEIVAPSFVTDTNLNGGAPFDTTPGVFDSNNVNEYLQGTGNLGGPLVTAANVSDRSDLRLFTSDKNATLQSMSKEAAFQATCNRVFSKMIDTVPRTVTLSDPVTPMTWKGVDLAMDISSTGNITVAGLFRYLYTTKSPQNTVSYTTTSKAGNSTEQRSSTSSGTGTSLYGNTTYYPFNSSIPSGTTSLNIQSSISYPLNTDIFVLPRRSTVDSTSLAFTIRAAALTTLVSGRTMTGVLYVPVTKTGVFGMTITNTTVNMKATGTRGGYTLFEGSVTPSTANGVVVKVSLGSAVSASVKSLIFVGGV